MRVGIAGAGFMGRTHAAAWAETEARIVGITAETPDQARDLADQCGARGYSTLQAMLADVDVLDVCTPTHLHEEMVLQAAEAGKHVVCEKPLARTLEQCRAMIAACQKAGVKLLVAHVVRFFPEYSLAKAAVERGEIGRPGVLRLARGSFRPKKPIGNWFLDFEKSGGIMLDLMIHDFDYARWVAGEVESVFARQVTIAWPEAPVDYGMAILRHRDGALAHITGAWAYPPPVFRTRLEIAGDAGLIEFDSQGTAPVELLLQQTGGSGSPDVAVPASVVSESPYTTQIKEFYSGLVHDQPVRVSAVDGQAAVQIALAAIESARLGQAVAIKLLN